MKTISAWPTPPWLAYGFGDSSQPWADDTAWRLPKLRVPPGRVVSMEQVHGDDVAVVTETDAGSQIAGVDGLVTDIDGIFLLVRTADCIPLLLVDTVRRVVAVAHSGREGARHNIVGRCVLVMQQRFGCRPRDILAALGPAIAAASYEVDASTHAAFVKTALAPQPAGHLDLRAEITTQLAGAGLPAAGIAHLDHDTHSDERYFSWRRRQTEQRQVSIIGKIWVDENTPHT